MSSNKSQRVIELQGLVSGLTKRFANTQSILVGGKDLAMSDILEALQGEITALNATDAAKAAFHEAVAADKEAHSVADPVFRAVRRFVVAAFGDTLASSQALSDFGIAPRKVATPQTVGEKAQAVAKQKATRTARHTLGPKQRSKIHGGVDDGSGASAPAGPSSQVTTSSATPSPMKVGSG